MSAFSAIRAVFPGADGLANRRGLLSTYVAARPLPCAEQDLPDIFAGSGAEGFAHRGRDRALAVPFLQRNQLPHQFRTAVRALYGSQHGGVLIREIIGEVVDFRRPDVRTRRGAHERH
jgi:hypothetical protein